MSVANKTYKLYDSKNIRSQQDFYQKIAIKIKYERYWKAVFGRLLTADELKVHEIVGLGNPSAWHLSSRPSCNITTTSS